MPDRPILLFHKIDNSFEWGITRQTIKQFEREIRFLSESGYKTVTFEEIDNLSTQDKKVVLTFDDGYESIYQNALPILQKHNMFAYIFIPTGFVGKENSWDANLGNRRFKHLGWEQIKEMSEYGFLFGSHSVNHPDLTRLSDKHLKYELEVSKDQLEQELGKKIDLLSYPFGKTNSRVRAMAKEAGYKKGFTICKSISPPNHFAVARKPLYLIDSLLSFEIKLKQSNLVWIEDIKSKIINSFANGTILVKSLPRYEDVF
ncbi:MAG TPA: polysaccharide deacetylase family protein [candidate division Zixibacteria bacterium]